MKVARVAEIHRYPVKTMLGERLDAVAISREGLRGDRIFAVRDEVRGEIEGGRKLPALLGCRARFVEPVAATGALPVPEIELPDGGRLRADAPDAAERLSQLAGQKLSLWPLRPAEDVAHYRRGAPDKEDILEELHDIFGRLRDEPLPDLGKLPPAVMTSSTLPGTYFDCFPLFLLSKTALATLSEAQPSSRFDIRRFRPNLLLEADAQRGFPENEWVGKRLRVGEAVFSVATECPRCVMTTHPIGDLPRDPTIMRALVKLNGGNLGVYAACETPGIVRAGDAVELLA